MSCGQVKTHLQGASHSCMSRNMQEAIILRIEYFGPAKVLVRVPMRSISQCSLLRPASGASSTVLHLDGKAFVVQSCVTFLLAPGNCTEVEMLLVLQLTHVRWLSEHYTSACCTVYVLRLSGNAHKDGNKLGGKYPSNAAFSPSFNGEFL